MLCSQQPFLSFCTSIVSLFKLHVLYKIREAYWLAGVLYWPIVTKILMLSLKNCNCGGLINISFTVSFRHPRHFFLHFLYLFVIVIVLCVACKQKFFFSFLSLQPSIFFFPHHYPLALAVNKSPAVYILSPSLDRL